jgi:PIN domain nuclease of toxin-antitoxin system
VVQIVLDTTALLSLLNSEPGSDIVAKAIPKAVISAVNLSEVVAKLSETGMPILVIRKAIQQLNLEVIPLDEQQAYEMGVLRSYKKKSGLSWSIQACVTLAKELNLPILTAEETWSELFPETNIQVIR